MKNYKKRMTLKVSKAFEKKLKELDLIHDTAVITHISRQYVLFPQLVHYITVESQYASGMRMPIDFIHGLENRKVCLEHVISEYGDYSHNTWRNEIEQAMESARKLHIDHKKND